MAKKTEFKPMLAYEGSIEIFHRLLDIDGMLYVSPKLDGIRATVTPNGLVSRSLKPIRNTMVNEQFNRNKYLGFDGELITGDPRDPLVFNKTTSNVMSKDKTEPTAFYVFDNYMYGLNSYGDRIERIKDVIRGTNDIILVEYNVVTSIEQLLEYEEKYLDDGFEGLIIRRAGSPYKYGRSTANEGGLGKFKRFVDSEAIIIGIEPLYHNENVAFKDELGNTARSSSKDHLIPMDTMGALHIRDIHNGLELKLGTGFSADERKWFWNNRDDLNKLIIKYSYFTVGMKNLPRHPSYKGIRDKEDMSQ